MPSPFPGFDPYLENPDFWPEVHSRLIVALADSLVPQVRPKYEIAIAKLTPMSEKIKQHYLEVRNRSSGLVVTVVEILSPVNKRPGEGRESYLQKRQRILGSLTNLVEIDLLRSFDCLPILAPNIQSDYRILISRYAQRPAAELYAFNLKDALPIFCLPLRSDDVEPTVNFQQLFTEISDKAGYDYRIDYTSEIVPALSETNRVWVKQLLAQKID
ncbi:MULTISPECIES: DUF4058 family protein [Planktothricoides]|uniref:DUF4058 family protein n=1 Tax=Planktothricoides raciborskii FACHB-1370 TaxID=2949576 RepID=A0ABR8EM74_9CYAN|nr:MULTISPECIES: DUF4058 family protein [Planktothricoides]KOR34155.1 hypothetical protein AM228_25815 [Planktothricoides sp. SR001]MBD2547914.1 DUF4058 family protein [Planktothricoides raciborskii FACHB-1370]MBD2586212.1 DUF4058 family protein [Planktothricoides raciborskii FACHB-1261]